MWSVSHPSQSPTPSCRLGRQIRDGAPSLGRRIRDGAPSLTIWLAAILVCGSAVADQDTPQSAPNEPAESSGGSTCETLYIEGCARLEAGNPSLAVKLLSRAAANCPDNLDYSLKLARTCAHLSDWLTARMALSRFEDKLDPDGLLLLADACARTGNTTRAVATLQRGLERWPANESVWLALIDFTLKSQQCGIALKRVSRAQSYLQASPRLRFRAAQAYYQLGQILGQTRVIHMPEGRAGQFVGEWLLIEQRGEPDHYLCCPRASALYALRRALDSGLDEPAAHLLHARIWQQAGRPEVGLGILQSREDLLLEDASSETLATFEDLALAANALDDFLRYARLRAACEPHRRTEILYQAHRAAAERYNQRGDDAMYRGLLRRALVLRPDDADLMLQLADAAWDAGAREEAVVWYRRVLALQPAHQARGRILPRLGD